MSSLTAPLVFRNLPMQIVELSVSYTERVEQVIGLKARRIRQRDGGRDEGRLWH